MLLAHLNYNAAIQTSACDHIQLLRHTTQTVQNKQQLRLADPDEGDRWAACRPCALIMMDPLPCMSTAPVIMSIPGLRKGAAPSQLASSHLLLKRSGTCPSFRASGTLGQFH